MVKPHLKLTDDDKSKVMITREDTDGIRLVRLWTYANDTERRAKMLQAHEYLEGWHDAWLHFTDLKG
jgi:hypothetical protein